LIRKVSDYLYVGDITCCNLGREQTFNRAGLKVVHACRNPCFERVKAADEFAVVDREGHDLYLDLIDSPRRKDINMDAFKVGVSYIEEHIELRTPNKLAESVLVHCAEGKSRSAALALVYLARNDMIMNGNYLLAHQDYCRIDKNYYPGTGLMDFLSYYWIELLTFNLDTIGEDRDD
jgi:hypothetical protein